MDGAVAATGGRARARGRDAARELAEREQFDAAALAIAERVRSSLSLEQVLQQTADDLGYVTGSARCLIQLAPNADGACVMLEWDRGDTRPLGIQPPTPIAARVFATGEPIVIADVDDDANGLREYLSSVDASSAVTWPIRWQDGRVLATVGFQDSRPRDWRRGVVPLLQRLEGQLAAAFVQAELYERQREAMTELEGLARMREELIANVSHELRTPVAAITGLVKTLRREDLGDNDARRDELLCVLDQQTDRLVDLAGDLLDFSRFRHGKQRVEPERIPFSDLIARALRETALPEGRRLHLDIDDCDVEADPNRMIQVLTNLLVNAVRHGEGDVFVTCRQDGDHVVLEVSDEGAGIRAGREDELFEPFAHDSDRTDSTGLGLSISRAIVEAHGGSLVYRPGTADRRHRFVVQLPTPKGEEQVQRAP